MSDLRWRHIDATYSAGGWNVWSGRALKADIVSWFISYKSTVVIAERPTLEEAKSLADRLQNALDEKPRLTKDFPTKEQIDEILETALEPGRREESLSDAAYMTYGARLFRDALLASLNEGVAE
jgi:hypothetical protein